MTQSDPLGVSDAAITPIAVRASVAAKLIDVTPAYIHKLINNGSLPSTKIGRSRRILVSDLRALAERGC